MRSGEDQQNLLKAQCYYPPCNCTPHSTQQLLCLNAAQDLSSHTQDTQHIKYSQLHTNWVPDVESCEHLLDWSVIITDLAKSIWLFMCITSDVACGKDMSGLEWRFSVMPAMYVPHLPVEPTALLTSPSGTGSLLFKQCWWARNMAQSAPHGCSLW